MNKILGIIGGTIAFAVAFIAASMAMRTAMQGSNDRPVASDIMKRPWVAQTILPGKFMIDTPWILPTQELKLPSNIQQLLTNTTNFTKEADGLAIASSTFSFKPGTPFSLDGAADGAMSTVAKDPTVSSVTRNKNSTTVMGVPGIEYTAEINRKKGESLKAYGVVFQKGNDVFQVIVVGRSPEGLDLAAWQKVRKSIRAPKA